MTAKFSEARRRTFLAALGATGNQTLAAEKAKVSRSWVQLHRSTDPDFKAACEAAVAEAKTRLRLYPERRPPSGWGFLDGAELVVKGANGRRAQIARSRLKQWSPRVEQRFLAALAATCNVRASCAEAGMSVASAYAHRKRWHGFAQRWDEAIETGYTRIEFGLLEHACNLFSLSGPPELAPMPEMNVKDAIRLLHMHKHQARGIGKAPGKRWLPPPSLDDPGVRERIIAKLEVIERMRRAGLSEEELERDRAEWARRRGQGRALRPPRS